MKDVVNEYLPDGTTANPYYNANWPGDKDYLKGNMYMSWNREIDNGIAYSNKYKIID